MTRMAQLQQKSRRQLGASGFFINPVKNFNCPYALQEINCRVGSHACATLGDPLLGLRHHRW